ncbi:serine hydrolase [Luteimonas sp. SJ-92]|uniref:Serine hydrolase n=1 Tax=Luteimonas salinisoli TaxID=2752307 RepID=A0A853JIQ4_9GAMM|nr:serine hydrolase [Luteimonas salinisoli]NZA28459.1 serine hydrolase [Luteimonas salinisoli]
MFHAIQGPFASALALVLTLATPVVVAAELSPEARAALDSLLEEGRQSRSDAVLVLHDGRDIGSYYRDGTPPAPIELMSATKSVVALGIGQLLAQGGIASLDQPVADFYPEWKQRGKRDVTVRMLLNHTSGLQNVMLATEEIYPAPDAVQLALAADLGSEPGAEFFYNNKAVNLLAGIIEKASGKPMDAFFNDGLFGQLGVQAAEWDKDAAGNPYAMAGLPLSAADAARIGQLVLDRGRYEERQLVPAAFIDEMLAQGQDGEPGCGLLWWRRPAWMHFSYDPGSAAMLREKGVPESLVQRIDSALAGARFDGRAAMFDGLQERFGEEMQVVREELIEKRGIGPFRLFDIDEGPVVAYEAQGYLGQYIVVVPMAGLVAVRQIAASDGDEPQPRDGYTDFTGRVIALAQAMGKLPPQP